MIKKIFVISAILLTSFNIGYAQDSNSAPNVSGQIEEILVTATRRAETDILTTPIPMTALNDNMIEKYGKLRFGNIYEPKPKIDLIQGDTLRWL